MRTRIALSAVFPLLALSLTLLTGSGQAQDQEPAEEAQNIENQTEPDTSPIEGNSAALRNITELQQLTGEVETRLEKLVTLLSEGQHSVTQREQKLDQMEAILAVKAAEIANAEQQLTTQKTISWVVLALGVGAVIFAFVMPKGRAVPAEMPGKSAPQNVTQSKTTAVKGEAQTEVKKPEDPEESVSKRKIRAKANAKKDSSEPALASTEPDSNGKEDSKSD